MQKIRDFIGAIIFLISSAITAIFILGALGCVAIAVLFLDIVCADE